MMYWDREEVMIRIRQLYRLRRDISYVGISKTYPLLLYAAHHYFSGWAGAVNSAGIDYNKVRRQVSWSRKRIKEELLSLYREGEDLSYNKFEKRHPKLLHAAQYHFGSWEKALSCLRIDYQKVRKVNNWSREKILETIRRFQSEGVDLSPKAMHKDGNGAVVSAAQFFYGSWREAISRAGLDYSRIRKREKWPRQRVIDTLKELRSKGMRLTTHALQKSGYGKLVNMANYYFSTWAEALEKAGISLS